MVALALICLTKVTKRLSKGAEAVPNLLEGLMVKLKIINGSHLQVFLLTMGFVQSLEIQNISRKYGKTLKKLGNCLEKVD